MAMDATPKVFRSLEIMNPTARAFFSNVLSGPFILIKHKTFLMEIPNRNKSLQVWNQRACLIKSITEPIENYLWRLNCGKKTQNSILLALENLDTPTYVLYAKTNFILDAQYHGGAFIKMTGAKLEMVPKAGHMLPATKP